MTVNLDRTQPSPSSSSEPPSRTTNHHAGPSFKQNSQVRSSPPTPVVPVPCTLSPFVIRWAYPGQSVLRNAKDRSWMYGGFGAAFDDDDDRTAGGGGFFASLDKSQSVYGGTFRKVTSTVPRVADFVVLWLLELSSIISSSSSSKFSSSGSSSDSEWSPPPFFFLLLRAFAAASLGTGPNARNPSTERKNPSSSSWFERIFRSWSVIPFPTSPIKLL